MRPLDPDHYEVVRLLLRLLEGDQTLSLSTGWEGGFRAVVIGPENRSAVRDTLLDVLRAVAGQEPTRRCNRCGQVRRLDQWPEKARSADGKQYWCRVCERERLRKYTKKGRLRAKKR